MTATGMEADPILLVVVGDTIVLVAMEVAVVTVEVSLVLGVSVDVTTLLVAVLALPLVGLTNNDIMLLVVLTALADGAMEVHNDGLTLPEFIETTYNRNYYTT